jgi:hypothetical protein
MFTLDSLHKGFRFIEAQELTAVIDEQIEARKEVLTQYSSNARICRLDLRDVLNDC